jgi:hypothetical protein
MIEKDSHIAKMTRKVTEGTIVNGEYIMETSIVMTCLYGLYRIGRESQGTD